MLDDPKLIDKYQVQDVFTALEKLDLQSIQAWQETKKIPLPNDYHQIQNIVVAGMGGSHLGAQLINSLYNQKLKIPLTIQHQYHTPGFTNKNTLFLATSFSGNTEETLEQVKSAHQQKAKIFCISSGGKLSQFAKNNNLPCYVFDSSYNPSKIPRYGSGYLFFSQLNIIARLGLIDLPEKQVKKIISQIKSTNQLYLFHKKTNDNPVKQLALSLHRHNIIIFASQHLTGSAYILKNQLNESSKNFACMFEIPELNHHLLEGLKHPFDNKKSFAFLNLESQLYNSRNVSRFDITKELLTKMGYHHYSFSPQSTSPDLQAFETLVFSGFLAVYLGLLNQESPGPNPWVDLLKNKLSQLH